MLSNIILRWIDFLKSYPKSTQLGLFTGVVILAVIASQINITQDIYNVLPDGRKFERFQKLTRNKDVLFSISYADSVDEERLLPIASDLASALESTFAEELTNITVEAPYVDPSDVVDHYTRHLYAYLSTEKLREVLGDLNADSVVSKVRLNHGRLYTLESGISKKLIFLDPLGLSSLKLSELQTFSEASPFHEEGGVLVLNDQKAILVKATANFEISDLGKAAFFQDKLDQLILQFGQKGESVECFAGFLISAANSEQVKADTWLTVSLTIIFIILLLLFFYRNRFAPFYFLIPGILGILFSLAMMSLFRREISGIAIGAGAVVIGIVLDYSFHFFTHFKHKKSLRETISTITTPLVTSCLTTVLAFGVLLFTETSILQDFGLFASLSLIGTAFSILCILPAFLDDSTFTSEKDFIFSNPQLGKWMKRLLVLFIVVVTYFTLKEAPNIAFDSNLENLNYFPDHLKKAELNLLGLDSKKDRRILIVSTGADKSEAQMNNHKLFNILQNRDLDGVTSNVLSTARFQIPLKELKERRESWNYCWQEFQQKYALDKLLDSLEVELGYTADAFDRFKRSLSINEDVQPPPVFPLLPQLTQMLVDSTEDWNYLTYVHVKKGKEKEFHEAVDRIEGIVVLDRAQIATGIFEIIQSDFNYIVLASAMLVILTLLLVYGRIELTLITILPMVIGWIWIMGIASYLDLRFNLVNIIVTTFIFGLGDDYAIFITDGHLRQYRYGKKTLDIYRTSIILSGLTTLLGTGVLILAQHPAIQSIAFISVVGMSSIIFLSLTLQLILLRGFIFGRASKGQAPLTIWSFPISVFAFMYFLTGCMILTTLQFFLRVIPFGQVHLRLLFANILRLFAGSVIYIMMNLRKDYYDMHNLDFKNPSVIIANHQSFVDILVMTMLNPRVILLTNDWVYNSPFFGMSVRYAGYIKAVHAVEDIDRVKKKVSEGYSIVIFPEGARSWNEKMRRYHKGAFLLAEQLKLDISPVLLHGIGYAMTKGDFLLKNTTVSIKALPRIRHDDQEYGSTYQERAKNISRHVRKEYEDMCVTLGHSGYQKLRVLNNFIYKTPILEWYARLKWRLNRKRFDYYHELCPIDGKIYDLGCGYGFLGFYLSYRGPKRKVIGLDNDEEKIELAHNCYDRPENLEFRQEDISNCSIENADVIFLNDVLQYVDGDSHEWILENGWSSLNKGGKVIIQQPLVSHQTGFNMGRFIEKWVSNGRSIDENASGLQYVNREGIEKLANGIGATLELIEDDLALSSGLFILSK